MNFLPTSIRDISTVFPALGVLLFVVSGCYSEAISSKAAPAQAFNNMKQIALGLELLIETKSRASEDNVTLIDSNHLESWRQEVAVLLADGPPKNPRHPCDEFRIPLTCSHSTGPGTNVFLIADAFPCKETQALDQQSTGLCRMPSSHEWVVVVIDNYCVSWESLQVVAFADDARDGPLSAVLTRDLPHIAIASPVHLVTLGGSVTSVRSLKDAAALVRAKQK